MNFYKQLLALVWTVILTCLMAGCQDHKISSSTEINDFSKMEPGWSKVSEDVKDISGSPGPYRVIAGDVLEFTLPFMVERVEMAEEKNSFEKQKAYHCRVSSDGTISMPLLGQVFVEDLNLPDIEALLIKAYHPKYLVDRPAIVGKVIEYQKQSVTILGAVKEPGIVMLQHDEMTLYSAVMKAGGITDKGAMTIEVTRKDKENKSESVLLPIRHKNVPMANIQLRHGDHIEVKPFIQQSITVTGLVNRPGVFPIEPGMKTSVIDALAYAGGLNTVADPQVVRVMRQNENGELINIKLGVKEKEIAKAASIQLRSGDIITVDQTVRTRTRLFLSEILKIGTGINVGKSY